MRNLPPKILLPQKEAKLQQLTQLAQLLLLRLRELPLQESMERKVVLEDFLAAVAVDKWDAVGKAVKAVKAVKADKWAAAAVKVDKWADKAAAAVKVDKVVAAVDKVDRVAEWAEIGLQIKELEVGQIEFCHG